uniref:Uncharacterized protein n=1 Tax=Tetraselmis sp. GSL018 TaxID=582737 RepID=A0A061QNK4_9CHLO
MTEIAGNEYDLVKQLKQKYNSVRTDEDKNSNGTNQQQTHKTDYSFPDTGRADRPVDIQVKICPQCTGAGELQELYGYRVLTKPCLDCGGNGIQHFKHGKRVEIEEGTMRSHCTQDKASCREPLRLKNTMLNEKVLWERLNVNREPRNTN